MVVKETKRNNLVVLNYKEDQYSMEYGDEAFILKRLSDNKILKIFNDNIGFMVQCDKDNETHFIVSSYENKEADNEYHLQHYLAHNDKLVLLKSFSCIDFAYEKCHITDSSYLINLSYGKLIYNLENCSKIFDEVYNDGRLDSYFNKKTILVSKRLFSPYRNDIEDNITYGISPETLTINTPIWSELQQRYITLYSKDQLVKIIGYDYTEDNDDLGELTIKYEVEKYLNLLAKELSRPQSVYQDSFHNDINVEFVRKLAQK